MLIKTAKICIHDIAPKVRRDRHKDRQRERTDETDGNGTIRDQDQPNQRQIRQVRNRNPRWEQRG